MKSALSPDEFLGHFPPPMQALANQLRALVRQALPLSFEDVKMGWQLIGFSLPNAAGRKSKPIYVGFIIPHEDFVTLGFQQGILLSDRHGRLLGAAEKLKQVRYISFRTAKEIRKPECLAWIKQAAELALMPAAHRAYLRTNKVTD